MKWYDILINTKREAPSDIETVSGKLMVRASLVAKLLSGVFLYTPLGMRVLLKVVKIIREEMNNIGSREVLLSVLQPIELLKETGRDKDLAPILFKSEDRAGKTFVLGPTHEEVITHLARNEISSYRQLPVTLYQIQTKFRDEPRPRGGVLRTKEFLMKDSYSFNKDWECLDKSYKDNYGAYLKIFERAGVNVHVVEADTGAIGGKESHEFMCPSESGEDSMVKCSKCSYSANVEKAECLHSTANPENDGAKPLPLEEVMTPGKHTVEEVAKQIGVNEGEVVKTIVVSGEKKYYACLIRGDHELNLAKLRSNLNELNVELATQGEVEKVTRSAFGFTGPVGLNKDSLAIVCDNAIENMHNFITGGNTKDIHLRNVNLYRDFKPDRICDIRLIKDGDPCPRCLADIKVIRSIEVGHIFKLGTKYSESMGLTFLTEKGESNRVIMGCYGIGVNRIIAAAIESHHDERGIIWPKEIAPFDVYIASVNPNDPAIEKISREIHDGLVSNDIEVLWDDRDVSAGVKFSDADLLGIPVRVTVGKKFLKSGACDVKKRVDNKEVEVEVPEVVGSCIAMLRDLPF